MAEKKILTKEEKIEAAKGIIAKYKAQIKANEEKMKDIARINAEKLALIAKKEKEIIALQNEEYVKKVTADFKELQKKLSYEDMQKILEQFGSSDSDSMKN